MHPEAAPRPDWFSQPDGQSLLDAQAGPLCEALRQRPAQPWLWLAPVCRDVPADGGRGWQLQADGTGWKGAFRCAGSLPLASESLGTVVLQHPPGGPFDNLELLRECARLLVPGGRLCLFALNPLSPYRLRWRGQGLRAVEPLAWRKRLRGVGLSPEPVSLGIGPYWRRDAGAGSQQGAGLRASYLLCADKRRQPLTPVRKHAPRLAEAGVFRAPLDDSLLTPSELK